MIPIKVAHFVSLFEQNAPIDALNTLFDSDTFSLDEIDQGNYFAQLIVNYAHSLCLATSFDVAYTSKTLLKHLPNTNAWKTFKEKVLALQNTKKLIDYFLKNRLSTLTYSADLPKYTRQLSAFHYSIQRFMHLVPKLYKQLKYPIPPLFPVTCRNESLFQYPENVTPLLCLSHQLVDWRYLYKRFLKTPVILVFPTTLYFLQSLQFPSFIDCLSSWNYLLITLDSYAPITQQLYKTSLFKHTKIHASPNRWVSKEWVLSLEKILATGSSCGTFEQHCRSLSDQFFIHHYGLSRYLSYQRISNSYHLYHPPLKLDSSAVRALQMKNLKHYLQRYTPSISQIKVKKKETFTLVHLVTQFIDFPGHAPSRLIETLLTHTNREKFTPFLFSSESYSLRKGEYPIDRSYLNCGIDAPHSSTRNHQRLEKLNTLGIPSLFYGEEETFVDTAHAIAKKLSELEIDFLVVHEDTTLHLLICKLCAVPYKVFIEHGTVPHIDLFDLVILNKEEEIPYHQKHFKKCRCVANPYQLDVKERWESFYPTRETWGLPKNAQLMTTICNRLHRVSPEMIHAIAQILRQVPRAYYLPIGTPFPKESFASYPDIEHKVKPLGVFTNPPNVIREMDLYLNDFPIGGGVTVVEVLAAGLPIVSMFNEEGLPPSRNAGHYIGKEKCVPFGDLQTYVKLACELLNNEEKYQEWKDKNLEIYSQMNTPHVFAEGFEKLLLDHSIERSRIDPTRFHND